MQFNDEKEPGALRTIGEVAQALGLKPHVLRYWEEQFPSLQPVKRSGGRRYYRPEDMVLILRISDLVHRKGYTLRGARIEIESGAETGLEGGKASLEGGETPEGLSTPSARDDVRPRLAAIHARLKQALEDDLSA
ncbi:MerR family transcriptional regulator [Novosphingobium sp. 9]|uniref:MerR family transcriptional regulator n=1 Tax=Novosphingobium sp. 9 TaxID=2025349 RepID=UPI0021B65389|nr:MerR family transcriptional regulator [Novosphingobium sp. 9]